MITLLRQRFRGRRVLGRVSGFGRQSGTRCVVCKQAADRPSLAAHDDAGYALIDALVALLILSLALVFALRATGQARRTIDQANEIRRARVLIQQLLETGPRSFQDAAGETDAFAWTVETRTTGADQPVAVCHRIVRLTSVATRRVFSASTLETCPTGTPA
jgi:Tfp pilus assembly protein PilV